MAWFFYLGSAVTAYLLWVGISFTNNYRSARKIGLPIIVSPIFAFSMPWMLMLQCFPLLIPILNALPFDIGKWSRVSYYGWAFKDKYATHGKLGDAFTIVSPGGLEVILADSQAVHEVSMRRKDFIKPHALYATFELFGPNVDTVEGETWQRHRKLTTPSFNEKSSAAVWNEAQRQAQEMLGVWKEQGAEGTKDTSSDTATLAMHVLSYVGFGISYPFRKGLATLQPGHKMTFQTSLLLSLRGALLFYVIPAKYLVSPIFPRAMRKLGEAGMEYQRYLEEMLASELKSISRRESRDTTLMGALIRASEDAHQSNEKGVSSHGLSDLEIHGNLFIFMLAGYETTANTLVYAIVLLAAHPEWQEWLAEEINFVFGENEEITKTSYEESFPRLKRCLAVMLETLRLYPAVVLQPKHTGENSQTLIVGERTCVIPSGTFIGINIQALHSHPTQWFPDPQTWRPVRWVGRFARPPHLDTGALPNEHLMDMGDPGTFMAWADGPRMCPGKKFAQVEFVAVMAKLFHKHRVAPVLCEGESAEGGKKRLYDMLNDSGLIVTLQMKDPKRVALKWTKVV